MKLLVLIEILCWPIFVVSVKKLIIFCCGFYFLSFYFIFFLFVYRVYISSSLSGSYHNICSEVSNVRCIFNINECFFCLGLFPFCTTKWAFLFVNVSFVKIWFNIFTTLTQNTTWICRLTSWHHIFSCIYSLF